MKKYKSLSIVFIALSLMSCNQPLITINSSSSSSSYEESYNSSSNSKKNSSIVLSSHEENLYHQVEFTLDIVLNNISNFNISWVIEDESVVTFVSKKTLQATFKGISKGSTSIKVLWEDDETIFDECIINIEKYSYSSWPNISSDAKDYYSNIDFTLSPSLLLTQLNELNQTLKEPNSYSQAKSILEYVQKDLSGNGNVVLFYTGESRKDIVYGYNENGTTYKYVNREHIWPKSRGNLQTIGEDTAYSDPHMLRLADADTNSSRGNNVYGEKKDSGTYFIELNEYKGEAARCVFYEHMAYNHLGLILDDDPSYRKDYSKNMGKVSVLLKWDIMNPSSLHELEAQENNRIQERVNNRNPFMDIPGLSLYLYGGINETTKELYSKYASDFGLDSNMYLTE